MRILIADDHALFRSGLKLLLGQQPDYRIVGEAASAGELRQLLAQQPAELVLMDYQMPGEDSAAVLSWLKQRYPATKILMLTGVQAGAVLAQLVQAGADGVVLKDGEASELLHAMAQVLAGVHYVSPAVAARINQAKALQLTPREFQILQAIAAGQSSQEIAARLLISARTVDKHRENLLAKFQVSNAMQLVQQARQAQLLAD